jgi:hypothetical protein
LPSKVIATFLIRVLVKNAIVFAQCHLPYIFLLNHYIAFMPQKTHQGCFYIGPIESASDQQAPSLPTPNHTVVDDNFSNGRKRSGGNRLSGKRRKSTLWDDNVSEFRVITNTVTGNPTSELSTTLHFPDSQPQVSVISFKDSLSQPIANVQENSLSPRNGNFDIPRASLLSPIDLRSKMFPASTST